jgi:Transport protein Avl9
VLALTIPDRRWVDFLIQTVNDTWDEEMPDRPKNLGYAGSEEFIRLQFEEYLLALLASVKYHTFLQSKRLEPNDAILEVGK